MANVTTDQSTLIDLVGKPDGGGVMMNYRVGATEEIYKGSFVTSDAGFASTFLNSEVTLGIAQERVTGGSSDGDNTCKVLVGATISVPLASVSESAIGSIAYALFNATVSLVATNGSAIGWIIQVPATGTAIIKMKMPGSPIS